MTAMVAEYRRLRRRSGEHRVRPYRNASGPGWLSLLWLDIRRGGGGWMVPVAAVFAWLILRNALTPGVALWPEITSTISNMAFPLMFLVVGIGGYAGGRERRNRVGELATSTATPDGRRSISLMASLFAWALLLYVAIALSLLSYGAVWATWGAPEIGVLVVPIPMMALGAAFGVLIGRVVGGETAPIIAVAMFMLLFVVLPLGNVETRPLSVMGLNSWYDPVVQNPVVRPFSGWAQLAWGIGLVGVVLALGAWAENRSRFAGGAAILSIGLAMVGAYAVTDAGYRPSTILHGQSLMDTPRDVCDESGEIVVCAHSAYERLLLRLTDEVNTFLGPIAGLDGVVDRVYVSSGNGVGGGWNQDDGDAAMSLDLAMGKDLQELITQHLWPFSFMMASEQANPVQYVVVTALARNIDVDHWPEYFYRVPEDAGDLNTEIERFAALSVDEQRAWFVAH